MSTSRRGKIAWFVMSLVVFIGLFYPTMVYLDLAGMGGYDGFASSQMMLDHGAWRADADRSTTVYLIFAAIYDLAIVAGVLGIGGFPVGYCCGPQEEGAKVAIQRPCRNRRLDKC